jgi:hypothetical protein
LENYSKVVRLAVIAAASAVVTASAMAAMAAVTAVVATAVITAVRTHVHDGRRPAVVARLRGVVHRSRHIYGSRPDIDRGWLVVPAAAIVVVVVAAVAVVVGRQDG